jgi:serine O-acetyltransferase
MTQVLRLCAWLLGRPLLCRTGFAKLLSLLVRIVFTCQISPGVRVGRRFVLAYGGMGTVVHGDCVIGDDVTIGTNVTLGGNFGKGGVPRLGNNVYVATGAKILGPVIVGDDVVIAANAVVLGDVEAGSVYAGIPATKIRDRKPRS